MDLNQCMVPRCMDLSQGMVQCMDLSQGMVHPSGLTKFMDLLLPMDSRRVLGLKLPIHHSQLPTLQPSLLVILSTHSQLAIFPSSQPSHSHISHKQPSHGQPSHIPHSQPSHISRIQTNCSHIPHSHTHSSQPSPLLPLYPRDSLLGLECYHLYVAILMNTRINL